MTIRDPIIAIEPSQMHINPTGHHRAYLYGQTPLSFPGYLHSSPSSPPPIPTLALPNAQSTPDEAPPLSFTPTPSNDQSPPSSLSSPISVIEDIKPLSDPRFNEPEDGAPVLKLKEAIASAIKYCPHLRNRNDICNEIERHRPWIISKSYREICEICRTNSSHARFHALQNISYNLSYCPGFKRARIEGCVVWVLSGEPIELIKRPNKNLNQKEPAPAGGRKMGRPRGKVLGESQVEDAKKKVEIKSKASSARKRKTDRNAAIALAESQPSEPMPLPQPAHSTLPWSHLGGLYPICHTDPVAPSNPIFQLPSSLNTPWPSVPPYNLTYPPTVHFGNLDDMASLGHWSVDAAPWPAPDPNFLFL